MPALVLDDVEARPEGRAVTLRFRLDPKQTGVRILRREGTVAPTASDDPRGALVLDGLPAEAEDSRSRMYVVVDALLTDGTTYTYALYPRDGAGVLGAAVTATVTPASRVTYVEPDFKAIFVGRLQATLDALVTAKAVKLRKDVTRIAVVVAYPLFERNRWPMISVHLESSDRRSFIGGGRDGREEATSEGARTQGASVDERTIGYVAWCQDAEERDAVARLLRLALEQDFALYEQLGFGSLRIVGPADAEDFVSFEAPVYYAQGTITFEATGRTIETLTPTAPGKIQGLQVRASVVRFTGIVGSATTTTLTVIPSPTWNVDQWRHYALRVKTGAGAGQVRGIAANTTDTATLVAGASLSPLPVAGDTVEIVDVSARGGTAQEVQYQNLGRA